MILKSPQESIAEALTNFDNIASKVVILLVVNMQTDSVEDDYDQFSIIITYYSDKELNDLILSFKEFASYVDVSFDAELIKNKVLNQFAK